MKYFLAAFIHLLITTLIVLKKDSIFQYDYFDKWHFALIEALALLVLVGFYKSAGKIIRQYRCGDEWTRHFVHYFIIYLGVNALFWLLTYPGTWSGEDYMQLAQKPHIHMTDVWYNWFTAFYLGVPIMLTGSYGGVTPVQIILISAIAAYILTQTRTLFGTNRRFFWLNYLPFLFPSMLCLNLFPFRYQMCSMLFVFVLSVLVFKHLKQESLTMPQAAGLGVIAAIVCFWRMENALNVIFIPLLAYLLLPRNKQLAVFALTTVVLGTSGILFQIYSLKSRALYEMYSATGMIFGLHFLYEKDFKSDNKQADTEVISKVFTNEMIEKVEVWDSPALVSKEAVPAVKEFKKVYFKLLLLNFGDVFAGKAKSIYFETGNHSSFRHWNEVQNIAWGILSEGLMPQPFAPELRLKICNILDFEHNANHRLEEKCDRIFYNLVIPTIFVFVMFAAGLVKRSRLLVLAPLLVLVQTFIAIVMCAQDCFFYFLLIYLFGWIFFPIFLLAGGKLLRS